jgi:FlaA1/EpsC-like NDP-sugar epimerase
MNVDKPLDGKRVLITGGTGSLGQVLVRRLLTGEMGMPRKIVVFSRDEAKQHAMRVAYMHAPKATDEIIFRQFQELLDFRIGDVRDGHAVASVLTDIDFVFNAAALKQVPTCEYFPWEAVRTNIEGPENIVKAIQEHHLPVTAVIGVSTDKACKPVNVMGMTKAIQERVFINANLRCPETRFICVRYGNVLASRGSVIPFFREQIRVGGPVTITTAEMTRFLLSLDDAVDVVFSAVRAADPGETFIPRVPSARVTDIAAVMIGERAIATRVTGIRPGEKVHEILVSEEEAHRTIERSSKYYSILPMLPELTAGREVPAPLGREYSSADSLMSTAELRELLESHLLTEIGIEEGGELLA